MVDKHTIKGDAAENDNEFGFLCVHERDSMIGVTNWITKILKILLTSFSCLFLYSQILF